MTAALSNEKLAVFYPIDQSILLVDSPAEISLQVFFQGFRLADSFHGAVPVDIFEEKVDALQRFFVLRLSIQVIFPRLVRPYFIHRPRSARGSR